MNEKKSEKQMNKKWRPKKLKINSLIAHTPHHLPLSGMEGMDRKLEIRLWKSLIWVPGVPKKIIYIFQVYMEKF